MSLLYGPPLRFTTRQRQVISLIAAGKTNEEIGFVLGITSRTAKAHSDRLRAKLAVASRRQIPLAFRAQTGVDPFAVSDVARS
jgi:DNA-binding NarL/FixJ family response regulator